MSSIWSRLVNLAGNVTGVLPTSKGGTGQNSTATFPTSGVVVTEAATESLTNKTLDTTNTVTLLDTLFTLRDNLDTTKRVNFDLTNLSTSTTRTYGVPNADTTLVGTNASQTLSNKTLDNSNIQTIQDFNFTIQDNGDNTRQGKFELGNVNAGTTKTIGWPNFNLNFPTIDGSSGQVLSTDGAGTTSFVTRLTNPLTTAGDLIYSSSGTTAARLAAGTSVQVLHSGTTPSWGAVSLTADVSGTLPVGNGGTGQTSNFSQGGLIYGATTTTQGSSSAGTSQNWALSGGPGTPTFSNTTTTGKFVDGSADEIQMRVQGHSTQTSNTLTVEKSDATILLAVTNVNGTNIRGTTTNDNAATGFVGEYVEQTRAVASTTGLTTATDKDVTATAPQLTAGDWEITGFVGFSGTSTTVTKMIASVSTTANSQGATDGSLTFFGGLTANLNLSDYTLIIPTYRVSISASTTYHLVASATFVGGTVNVYGRIAARRWR